MPAIIATPSSTAIAVSAERSLRSARPAQREADHARAPSGGRGSSPATGARGGRRSGRRPGTATESAIAAAPASWVTMTIVWPNSSTARRSRSSTSRLAFESRLPVGSSANTTAGRVIERARNRDALRLAAGELARAVRAPVAQADRARSASRATRGRHRRRRSAPAARCSARRSGPAAGCSSGR